MVCQTLKQSAISIVPRSGPQSLVDVEAELAEALRVARLREEFIAVLAHDLRNPLAAINAGTRLLRDKEFGSDAQQILAQMKQSVERMLILIDDLTDFARGRLGDGIALASDNEPIEPILRHIISELMLKHPDRFVVADINLTRVVTANGARIGQLISNLLGNALTYGAPERPVGIQATATETHFELIIRNGGSRIPQTDLPHLFEPFSRGAVTYDRGSVGLGLYIVAEIARAHGGTIEAHSDDDETRFVFRMPLDQRS